MTDSPTLKSDLLRFIEDPGAGRFEDLALRVFRHQWERNADYRRLLDQRGCDPGTIRHWTEVPAVSTTAFKWLRLACGPSRIVFRTSGTSRGRDRRGEHHLPDVDLYRAALRHSFRERVIPDRRLPLLALTPSPDWAPDSSLGFMMADVLDHFGGPGSGFFLGADGLRFEPLVVALAGAESSGEPVALLGTVLALVHLLDRLEAAGRSFRLPVGSRIMDTGGFKGQRREVSRGELIGRYASLLGIGARWVVNEYGMTEMSSQFYDASLSGGDPAVLRAPHWVRSRVIDPATGRPTAPGEAGLLRHFDLANLDTVASIETEDLGLERDGGFVLLGRAAGAEPRGCSIAADELLAGEGA